MEPAPVEPHGRLSTSLQGGYLLARCVDYFTFLLSIELFVSQISQLKVLVEGILIDDGLEVPLLDLVIIFCSLTLPFSIELYIMHELTRLGHLGHLLHVFPLLLVLQGLPQIGFVFGHN